MDKPKGRPVGTTGTPYKMSKKAIRQRQVAPIKHGKASRGKVQKFLKEMGFTDKELTVKKIQELAPQIVEDLKLIEKTATTRQILLEMYKRTGDIGLNMLNQIRELDMYLNKLKGKYIGREDELILNKDYIRAIDLMRKLSKDFNKLGIDKTKIILDEQRKRGDDAIIDIDATVLEDDES